MKTKLFKGLTVMALLSIFLFSCEEEAVEVNQPQDDTSNDVAEVVKLQSDLMDIGDLGAISQSFEDLGFSKISSFGKTKSAQRTKFGKNARFQEDDLCALVTIKENVDGSVSIILDFGEEGCDQDGTLTGGVVTFTGSETDNSGVLRAEFDNFFERPANSEEEAYTLNGFIEGAFTWTPDEEFKYTEAYELDLRVEEDNGNQATLKADGINKGNENRYVVNEKNFEGTSPEGTFSGVVVEPLVYDLICEDVDIYTEGSEAYLFNGEAVTVEYGDGTCDDILTIIQKGITIIIDLDEFDGE
ncbi:MAG: hypothetical protein AAFN93_17145 [Bacteroidota bacterium]